MSGFVYFLAPLFRWPKVVCAKLLLDIEAALNRAIEREIRALEHERALRCAGKALRSDPAVLAEIDDGIARLRAVLRGERAP